MPVQIQRRAYRRRGPSPTSTCGCLLLVAGIITAFVVFGLLLLLPALPDIALRVAGFQPLGDTGAVFSTPAAPPPATGPDAYAPPQVVVDAGSYGRQSFSGDTGVYSVTISTAGGSQQMTASFTEAGIMDICRQYSPVCANGNDQFRNVSIDLRPGGGVIYADVSVPGVGVSQRVGVVLHLNNQMRFDVIGVDLNGTLYAAPPGQLAGLVNDLENVINDVLDRLKIEAGGSTYSVSQIYIDDDTLTAVLR